MTVGLGPTTRYRGRVVRRDEDRERDLRQLWRELPRRLWEAQDALRNGLAPGRA